MDWYYLVVLAGVAFVSVGFLGCLVWVVLDNKKFYEALDKQRHMCYNEDEEKPRRFPQ